MEYMTCLEKNIEQKIKHILQKHGEDVNIRISSSNRKCHYSDEEIAILNQMKKDGQQIS